MTGADRGFLPLDKWLNFGTKPWKDDIPHSFWKSSCEKMKQYCSIQKYHQLMEVSKMN